MNSVGDDSSVSHHAIQNDEPSTRNDFQTSPAEVFRLITLGGFGMGFFQSGGRFLHQLSVSGRCLVF